jgi:hypothetical protein
MKSDVIDKYMEKSKPTEYAYYVRDKILYIGQWEKYQILLLSTTSSLKIMSNPVQRYKYLVDNFSKGCDMPGACADDCNIFAYDSLLRCDGSYEKLIVLATLHPGDSDTIGAIASSWFSILYNNMANYNITKYMFNKLEYKSEITKIVNQLPEKLIYMYFESIYMSMFNKSLDKFMKK